MSEVNLTETYDPGFKECPCCSGSGWANTTAGVVLCPDCKGDGQVKNEA